MSEQPVAAGHSRWKAGLAVVGAFFLLLLMMGWIYDSTGLAVLRGAVARAQAMGKPLTMEELLSARPALPDDRNGALILLGLKDKLDKIPTGKEWDDLPVLGSNSRALQLGHRWPDDAERLTRSFMELKEVQEVQVGIDELRKYPGGQFTIANQANPIVILLPHLSLTRQVARHKCLQVYHRAMAGNTTRLADDLQLMLAPSHYLAQEPILISALVQVAINALAVETVENVLGLNELTEAQLAAMDKVFSDLGDANVLEGGMLGERACFYGAGEYYRRKAGRLDGNLPDPKLLRFVPGFQGLIARDEAFGLDRLNRMVQAAASPDPLAGMRALSANTVAPPALYRLSAILLPSLDRASALAMRGRAEVACARAALAAERYRLAKGEYPPTLDTLVPTYLNAVPLDPFGGKPIRIAHQPDRVCIYSVGDDYVDNGGDLKREFRKKGGSLDWGFILLKPEYRNQPPLPPETQPDEDAPASQSAPVPTPANG